MNRLEYLQKYRDQIQEVLKAIRDGKSPGTN